MHGTNEALPPAFPSREIGRAEDGQKPDNKNLSDLAFCADWLGGPLGRLIEMQQRWEQLSSQDNLATITVNLPPLQHLP